MTNWRRGDTISRWMVSDDVNVEGVHKIVWAFVWVYYALIVLGDSPKGGIVDSWISVSV